jgi:hypothetical protein
MAILLIWVIFILLVEVRERIADVFDFDLGGYAAEVERMDLDGSDKARQRHLLKPVVDKRADGLGARYAVWPLCERVPADFNRHRYLTSSVVDKTESEVQGCTVTSAG